MRLHGWCRRCKKWKMLNVENWPPVTGICDECETEERAERRQQASRDSDARRRGH